MVFDTDAATVYQVRRRHRNEEVRELVPAGVMISDRGKSYDAVELAGVRKQKCLGHVLRSVSAVLKTKTRGACVFAKRPKASRKVSQCTKTGRGHSSRGRASCGRCLGLSPAPACWTPSSAWPTPPSLSPDETTSGAVINYARGEFPNSQSAPLDSQAWGPAEDISFSDPGVITDFKGVNDDETGKG